MMDESDTINDILGGNIDAYALLVNKYQTGLIIHCENIVKNREDAEDITQGAFIKAYRGLHNFDPAKARFSTWLYRIATNLALDYLRRNKRNVDVDDIELLAEATMPTHLEDEEKQIIADAVQKLQPPEYAKVIQAYYWHGKSYKQLAAEFKTTTNTIGTWIRRAKAQLKEELL